MRIFVILAVIVRVWADKLGHNYKPVAHSRFGLSFTPGSRERSNAFSLSSPLPSESINQPSIYDGPVGFGGYETEFYSFTAPEDVIDDNAAAVQNIAESFKRKLRVIFIKNPENTAYENAVLALAKQATEQRTAIYVLNKQHDISELAGNLNNIHSNAHHKPEVHFVKYRTPEDAYYAQRAIQSQYDSSDNFAENYSGLRASDRFVPPDNVPFHGSFQTPNNDYIPSSS